MYIGLRVGAVYVIVWFNCEVNYVKTVLASIRCSLPRKRMSINCRKNATKISVNVVCSKQNNLLGKVLLIYLLIVMTECKLTCEQLPISSDGEMADLFLKADSSHVIVHPRIPFKDMLFFRCYSKYCTSANTNTMNTIQSASPKS